MLKRLLFLIILFSFFSLNAKDIKYIFYFIGDGMGRAQVEGTEYYLSYLESKGNYIGRKKLNMSMLPVQGLASTFSYDSYITDSAAAATALGSGYKTKNGTVALDENLKIKDRTLAEKLRDKGFQIALITSVSIDHATPACFYAHRAKRKDYVNIAKDLATFRPDFLASGGLKKTKAQEILKGGDYLLVNTTKEILNAPKNKKIYLAPKTPASGTSLPYAIDRKEGDLSLKEICRSAIDRLVKKGKFFMMLEGGKIDWACHENDSATVVKEIIDFDNAIACAVEFAKKYPDETLIVVTADHECGACTLGRNLTKYKLFFDVIDKQKVSGEKFTFLSSKILKEKSFKKLDKEAQFKEILKLIKETYSMSINEKDNNKYLTLTPKELSRIKNAFDYVAGYKSVKEKKVLYGVYDPLAITLNDIIAKRLGFAWSSTSHSGVSVGVSAYGSDKFSKHIDNCDIPKIILDLVNKK